MPLEHEIEGEKKTEAAQKVRDAYERIFQGADGELVLGDLIRHCHIDRPCLVFDSHDRTAYNEGKRDVGMRILALSGKFKAMKEAIGV